MSIKTMVIKTVNFSNVHDFFYWFSPFIIFLRVFNVKLPKRSPSPKSNRKRKLHTSGTKSHKSFLTLEMNQNFYFKNGFWAKKWPNLAKNWHFWPNIGIFGLFDPVADQTMMQTSCLGVFSVLWVPKLLHTPIKIRIFGP